MTMVLMVSILYSGSGVGFWDNQGSFADGDADGELEISVDCKVLDSAVTTVLVATNARALLFPVTVTESETPALNGIGFAVQVI